MRWTDNGFERVLVSTVLGARGDKDSLDIYMAEGREGLLVALPGAAAGAFAGFVPFRLSWPATLTEAKGSAERMLPPSPLLTIWIERLSGAWSLLHWRFTRRQWRPA